MKPQTKVCIRLESVGRPKHTVEQLNIELGLAIKRIAGWLLEVHMGSRIRITIARDEAELSDRRSAAGGDLMGELESLLGEIHDVCVDENCANKEPHEVDSADCTSRKQGVK